MVVSELYSDGVHVATFLGDMEAAMKVVDKMFGPGFITMISEEII